MDRTGSAFLAIAMTVAGYLSVLCATPPNPPPEQKDRYRTDRIKFIAGSFPTIVRRIGIAAIMYHALLTVIPQYAPARLSQVCPLSPEYEFGPFHVEFYYSICPGTHIPRRVYSSLGLQWTWETLYLSTGCTG